MAKTATDPFEGSSGVPNYPGRRAALIVPSDTVDLANATKAIYVGGAGDITVIMAGDGDNGAVQFKAPPIGTMLNIQARRVMATGTTATLLIAIW